MVLSVTNKSYDVTVNISKTNLFDATWEVYGLNLFITESTVAKLSTENHESGIMKKAYIYKSHIKTLIFNGRYQSTFRDCDVGQGIELIYTMIEIKESELSIINC